MLGRAALVLLAAAILTTPAFAIKQDGDDFRDVPQKNPIFLEPYADESPARYRMGDPMSGLEDRRAAFAERDGYRYGYVPRRGDVRVRPYHPY